MKAFYSKSDNQLMKFNSLIYLDKTLPDLAKKMVFMAFFLTVTFSLNASELKRSQLEQVKSIVDSRCTICHGCYDAPCQLKLSAYEGLTRGATGQTIYSFLRLENQQPTRLFVDAHSEEDWRDLDFYSVLDDITTDKKLTSKDGKNETLLSIFLSQKEHFMSKMGSVCPKTSLSR